VKTGERCLALIRETDEGLQDVLTLFQGYHVKGGSHTKHKNQYWEAAKDIAYKMSSLVML
jgi:hypothetical protein